MADNDWVKPGAEVSVVVSSRTYSEGNYVLDFTVTRLTATQVVLDDGSRWRRDTLSRVGSRDGLLRPRDHAEIVKARRVERIWRTRKAAEDAYFDWKRGGTHNLTVNADLAEVAATALSEYVAAVRA